MRWFIIDRNKVNHVKVNKGKLQFLWQNDLEKVFKTQNLHRRPFQSKKSISLDRSRPHHQLSHPLSSLDHPARPRTHQDGGLLQYLPYSIYHSQITLGNSSIRNPVPTTSLRCVISLIIKSMSIRSTQKSLSKTVSNTMLSSSVTFGISAGSFVSISLSGPRNNQRLSFFMAHKWDSTDSS